MRGAWPARAAARPTCPPSRLCRSEWWQYRQLHALHRPQRYRPPHCDPRLHPRDQGPVQPRERWSPSFLQCSRVITCCRFRGDHYAKLWPVESFRRHGIRYTQDAQPKSDLYAGSLLPLINSRRIELFDLPVLIGQICSLERSTRHGAAERIDHPPHGHDDVVNAVAGVAAICTRTAGYDLSHPGLYGDVPAAPTLPPTPGQQAHAELMARVSAPVSINRIAPEIVSAWRAQRDQTFARAAADAAQRRHLP